MAAVSSCLGALNGARVSNWSEGQSALAGGAVKLLQAFIDSNGCMSLNPPVLLCNMVALLSFCPGCQLNPSFLKQAAM